jgi:hypothetical protein
MRRDFHLDNKMYGKRRPMQAILASVPSNQADAKTGIRSKPGKESVRIEATASRSNPHSGFKDGTGLSKGSAVGRLRADEQSDRSGIKERTRCLPPSFIRRSPSISNNGSGPDRFHYICQGSMNSCCDADSRYLIAARRQPLVPLDATAAIASD